MSRSESDADFDEFAVAAWPRLRWTAHMLTGDPHLADDLAQTALIRTYAAWSRVRRQDALAYSRRILVNANIDRLRRRRLTEVSTGVPESADESRRDALQSVEERQHLVQLLASLTERERKVVVLRYYFDLAEATVAHELGVSVGTVKSTASKALAKLRSAPASSGVPVTKEGS